MPTSKKRKPKTGNSANKGVSYGANIGQTNRGTNRLAFIVAAVAILGSGYYWWSGKQSADQLEANLGSLAQEGQVALENVRSTPNQGNGHLGVGAVKNYVEPFPTSGDHAASGVKAGFYDREMPKINLVHSIEHGNIVIYYDTPGDAAMDTLKSWTSRYSGAWDGVVATRSPGLGDVVVLTAWTKLLRLEGFDEAAAAAFLDTYRGRGPENQVR